MITNVLFTGVGGQGVILAGKILMEVALKAGCDVKESEVHGMAQRGGTVDCHVRFGDRVFSPLIPFGCADFIVSFELIESLRKITYLSNKGRLLINTEKIDPAPVASGLMEYPKEAETWIARNLERALLLDVNKALTPAVSAKAINIVMLGALSGFLEFPEEEWKKVIKSTVKEKFIDMNLEAFQIGRGLVA